MTKSLFPATLPVLAPALQTRIADMGNAEGKLTPSAAWRLACAFVDEQALRDCTFRVLVGANPKRGAGALAFAAYGGLSGTKGKCAVYAEKVGAKNAPKHLVWDLLHGYVALYLGGKAVEIPKWCAVGAKVPARTARKPRAPKPVAPAVPEAPAAS